MSNRQEILVTQKGAQKTARELGKVDKAIGGMTKAAIGYASAAGALIAINKSIELTKLASDAVNVEKAFRNLSKEPDKMLTAMKRAVSGTIEEFELMKQFNQAALLGLPLDRFDEMLAIARSAAQATGQSMDFMLNSIVTGIGRQSRLMIDNLGLIVSIGDANEVYAQKLGKVASELTQMEQKTAFANAVLDAGAKNIEKMGGAADGAFDGVNKLTAIIKDKTIDTFKNLVTPIDTAAGALADFMTISERGALSEAERNEKLMKDEFHGAMLRLKIRDNLMKKWQEEQAVQVESLALDAETQSSLRTTGEEYKTLAGIIGSVRAETFALMEIQHGQIDLLPTLTLETNDLSTAQRDQAEAALESGLKGLAMSSNLGEASRALANQYIVEGVFGAVKSALVEVPFPFNLLAAGAAGIAANAAFNSIIPTKSAATEMDEVVTRPTLIKVGDNAGGLGERVTVSHNGGRQDSGGMTLNFYGNITDREYVRSFLIPEIQKATRLNA